MPTVLAAMMYGKEMQTFCSTYSQTLGVTGTTDWQIETTGLFIF